MAITPLVARDQWIGLLFALTEQPHTFTWAELNFHRALADQAAVAIDNRRLLAETQQRAHREALIRQITRASARRATFRASWKRRRPSWRDPWALRGHRASDCGRR